MTKGEVDYAERQALNLFDLWNDVAGIVEKNTVYYYEIQGCIIDAVHCGIQMALNKKINIEEGNVKKNKLPDLNLPNIDEVNTKIRPKYGIGI